MPDAIALPTMLALFMAAYAILMWVVRMTNERGDEIVAGVIKGIATPRRTRSLNLYTQYLAYCVFGMAYLVVVSFGLLEMTRGVENDGVKLVGYMCTTLLLSAAVFITLLVPFLFMDMRRAVRGAPDVGH